MLKNFLYFIFILSLFLVIQGCSTAHRMSIEHSRPIALAANTRIGVVPFYNTTDEEGAGVKAAIITGSLLRTANYDVASLHMMDHKKMHHDWRMESRCAFAHDHNIPYVLKGSVNEWSYLSNSRGSLPVVGFSMQLRDTSTCNIVWNAVGSKTGHYGMSAAATAQHLISHMIRTISSSGY